MEAAMTSVQPFFNWLLQTTLIGSVVIGLILAAQKVMGGKWGPRWSHALWLVLVVRLLLPGAFPGQIDLLNLARSGDGQVEQQQPSDATKQLELSQTARISGGTEANPPQGPESGLGIQKPVTPSSETLATRQNKSKPGPVDLGRVLPFLWLAGALIMAGYLLWSNFVLWRIVRRDRPLLDQKTLELFWEKFSRPTDQ